MRAIPLVLAFAFAAGCLASPSEAPETPSSASYADLRDSPIRGLTPEEIDDLKAGRGMALALPAELNGWPGPKHVVELADGLELSAEQREKVGALATETNAKARRAGERVLAAHDALDRAFRTSAPTEATLEGLLLELADAEADLRGVHLAAHLETAGLLTTHQVARYAELRGYGTVKHASHDH